MAAAPFADRCRIDLSERGPAALDEHG